MDSELTIVLWYWQQPGYHKKYTPEKVHRTARAISANLSIPHRFLCITDRPEDIDLFTYPLWDKFSDISTRRWNDQKKHPQSWRRIKVFDPKMKHILGPRFVSVDVDCVVTGPLDEVFGRSEEFVICEAIRPGLKYLGCMFMMDTGSRPHLYTDFDQLNAVQASKEWPGSDQAWMNYRLNDEATWTDEDGVYIYGPYMQNTPDRPPENASIVFFNGHWSPWSDKIQAKHPWVREAVYE